MGVAETIYETIRESATKALAFDLHGACLVPIPEDLAALEVGVGCEGPLDIVEPASHGPAVVAYDAASRTGHGVATVEIIGEQGAWQLDIFDRSDESGCFVALLHRSDLDKASDASATRFRPRQAKFGLSATGVIEWVDDDFCSMLAWSAGDVVGSPLNQFIHPEHHEPGIALWAQLLRAEENQIRLRQRYRTGEGGWLWCDATDTNRLAGDGFVTCDLVDASTEMSIFSQLERRTALLDRLTEALPFGVLQLDADRKVLMTNPRWEDLTSWPAEVGSKLSLAADDAANLLAAAIDDVFRSGHDASHQVEFAADPTGPTVCELRIEPLSSEGVVADVLVTAVDVTESASRQRRLLDRSRRDSLTGAYNRAGIEWYVADRLNGPRNDELVVLYCDLDAFKQVNDTYGHAAGDDVLKQVASHTSRLVRASDAVCRIGGDEFLIVLTSDEVGDTRSLDVARQIEAAVRGIRNDLDPALRLAVSIGRARSAAGDTLDELIERADQDMYAQKGLMPGRGGDG